MLIIMWISRTSESSFRNLFLQIRLFRAFRELWNQVYHSMKSEQLKTLSLATDTEPLLHSALAVEDADKTTAETVAVLEGGLTVRRLRGSHRLSFSSIVQECR